MQPEPSPLAIALTGGPGAGKSVIAAGLAGRFAGRLVLVPEAATQVYTRRQTRWDRLDLAGRRDVQRDIYHTQLAQERALAQAHPGRVLLCDRGTIDGAAYWPEGPADYWRDLGTTPEVELARYALVIWLETAAALGLYDGAASNAVRFEDPSAAIDSGDRLLQLWAPHPRLIRIAARPRLQEKLEQTMAVVSQFLSNESSLPAWAKS